MSRHSFRPSGGIAPGHRSVAGGLARAAVFGVSDGLVSNVSLVIGFAGAGVDSSLVRLAGVAGAIAGATSMAAGEWVSISAQNELVYRELAVERRELEHNSLAIRFFFCCLRRLRIVSCISTPRPTFHHAEHNRANQAQIAVNSVVCML